MHICFDKQGKSHAGYVKNHQEMSMAEKRSK